jgi:hypothetical protein
MFCEDPCTEKYSVTGTALDACCAELLLSLKGNAKFLQDLANAGIFSGSSTYPAICLSVAPSFA